MWKTIQDRAKHSFGTIRRAPAQASQFAEQQMAIGRHRLKTRATSIVHFAENSLDLKRRLATASIVLGAPPVLAALHVRSWLGRSSQQPKPKRRTARTKG